MKKYNIYPCRSDLVYEQKNIKEQYNICTDIMIKKYKENNNDYTTIFYNNTNNEQKLSKIIETELLYFFKKLNTNKGDHIFIVGLGNDNHTADSIGPKTLKHIKVNSYLKNFKIQTTKTLVSALEPGVLGETGILTENIIKSVSKEINPNLIILIDSLVSSNINYLNKTIQITDSGINQGNGLIEINTQINKNTFNIPILVIGVTTAIEVIFTNNKNKNYIPYLLSSKDIDNYVDTMSKIIALAINNSIDNLS